MIARLLIMFEPITEADFKTLRKVATRVTTDRESIRVSLGEKPNWLIVEFKMARQTQNAAVDAIDRSLKYDCGRSSDTVIQFPRSETEEARAKRKNEKNKAKRRADRLARG